MVSINNPRQRIGILSFSIIASDARVLRQIQTASKHYDVVVVGEGAWEPEDENVSYHQLPEISSRGPWGFNLLEYISFLTNVLPVIWHSRIWIGKKIKYAYLKLLEENLDLIHINDFIALPSGIAAALDSKAVALYDAHEYSLDQERKPRLKSWLLKIYALYILKFLGIKADSYITVSEGIANLYRLRLGIDPAVILNAPERAQIQKREFDPIDIRIVHHGSAVPRRKLELLIEVVSNLDARYSLHFMLLRDSKEYIDYLKRTASDIAPEKVHFHDPVEPNMIVNFISKFDIGIHILYDNFLNNKYALPNKIFDYIAAGLVVVIGPSTEMAKIVKRFNLGIVSPSFAPEVIAEYLNSLSPSEVRRMRQASMDASNYLNAEIEMQKLLDIYQGLLASKQKS
jgi:glycosyltransferase involved in cell wall biosynthesis